MTDQIIHLSTFELDLFFASKGANKKIERHLRSCRHCEAYLDHLRTLQANAPASPLLPFSPAVTRAPRRTNKAMPPRFTFLAAALSTCLVVGLYLGLPESRPSHYVGIKGTPAVQLLIYSGETLRTWDGSSPIERENTLALQVACEGFSQVNVATLERNDQSVQRLFQGKCPANTGAILPFTLLVDNQPGPEMFSVVFSTGQLNLEKLQQALEAETPNDSVWITHFSLEKESE